VKDFAQLFFALDRTTRTSQKVSALESYFQSTPREDAAWALHFLAGQRLKRLVKTSHLRHWAAEAAGLPGWLVDECYDTVGDLAETLALIVRRKRKAGAAPASLHKMIESYLLPLKKLGESGQRELILQTWAQLDANQRLVWNKLITGAFRVGVSRALLVRALARISGLEAPVIEHRLMGEWRPTASDFERLMSREEKGGSQPAQPYPFYLASPLEGHPSALGNVKDWAFEWKWDGIRAQLIRRAGQCVLWSRGEEIITSAFPEIAPAAAALPDGTVLDGELLAWREGAPLPFSQLQRRLNRREAGAKVRASVPVVFMAYDLLECGGNDWRDRSLDVRREQLEKIVTNAGSGAVAETADQAQRELFPADAAQQLVSALQLSPRIEVADWRRLELQHQRARQVETEGIMLKRRDSPYGTGRQRGAWWKWKVAPFVCDAVLVAAQRGHGRRATLFTDYTFAIWRNNELVPVAKAYSGLTDAEIDAVDAFVRANTTGRFGPVRSVKPKLVFELAFDGIQQSTRHKAKLALRFPRIARQRTDKKPADADTVESLRALLAVGG
jgi:DNA ligase-1